MIYFFQLARLRKDFDRLACQTIPSYFGALLILGMT
jgi:hypothetical protein